MDCRTSSGLGLPFGHGTAGILNGRSSTFHVKTCGFGIIHHIAASLKVLSACPYYRAFHLLPRCGTSWTSASAAAHSTAHRLPRHSTWTGRPHGVPLAAPGRASISTISFLVCARCLAEHFTCAAARTPTLPRGKGRLRNLVGCWVLLLNSGGAAVPAHLLYFFFLPARAWRPLPSRCNASPMRNARQQRSTPRCSRAHSSQPASSTLAPSPASCPPTFNFYLILDAHEKGDAIPARYLPHCPLTPSLHATPAAALPLHYALGGFPPTFEHFWDTFQAGARHQPLFTTLGHYLPFSPPGGTRTRTAHVASLPWADTHRPMGSCVPGLHPTPPTPHHPHTPHTCLLQFEPSLSRDSTHHGHAGAGSSQHAARCRAAGGTSREDCRTFPRMRGAVPLFSLPRAQRLCARGALPPTCTAPFAFPPRRRCMRAASCRCRRRRRDKPPRLLPLSANYSKRGLPTRFAGEELRTPHTTALM